MRAIDRKLLRDLGHLKGQIATIAIVVGCGIATYVAMHSVWRSLGESKDTYYTRYRFADVFAHLERAPEALAARIEELPGVSIAYTRVVEDVTLPMPDMAEPAVGRLVSVPVGEGQNAPLNAVHLRAGRMPLPGRADEVVVVESFANAHGLQTGDTVPVVLNGRLRDLRVVGIGMSPEYVFAAPVGDFAPDDRGFAILWMDRDVLAPAFRMEGAFNDVAIRLQPGASEAEVLTRLDDLLNPYGGLGAIPRAKQASNFFIEGELEQLETNATVVPLIFLAVAAFLLNVVLSRLVLLQRPHIATLKAVGYSNLAVGAHFLELVLVIVSIGAAIGVALGGWMGSALTELYAQYFRFPTLVHSLDGDIIATAVAISAAAGIAGALITVAGVVRLPPAEAMRPPAPPSYELGLLDRPWLTSLLGVSTMMVLRELRRRPLRLLLSATGIGAAIAIIIVGRFATDSFTYLIDVVYHREQRGDMMVAFMAPMPRGVENQMRQLPGVLDVEGQRVVPVRFRSGPRYRDAALTGLPENARLRQLVDRGARPVDLPPRGLAISRKLGEILALDVGDTITVELRQGDRRTEHMAVAALVDDAFGLQGYMRLDELHRHLREEPSISMVQLRVDPAHIDALHERLKDMPQVAQVVRKETVVRRFREQNAETMRVMTLILTLMGCAIAIGVVYNNARVALSMRARDLASLRVLGFTRREISAVLLGELSAQLLLGIPIGLILGTQWTQAIMSMVDPEAYRMAAIVSNQTYAFAIAVAALAGLVSALLVRRRLDRLDLIGVLKTRE